MDRLVEIYKNISGLWNLEEVDFLENFEIFSKSFFSENWSCLLRGDITCIDHMWPWLLINTPLEMFPIAECLWIGGFRVGRKKWLVAAVVSDWELLTNHPWGKLRLIILYFPWDFGISHVNMYGDIKNGSIFETSSPAHRWWVLWKIWWQILSSHAKIKRNPCFQVNLSNIYKDSL